MSTVKRAGETAERLLAAATELFAERGFRATTLREVAARAGTNLASANYHFKSKQQLYLTVLRRHLDEMQERLSQAGAALDARTVARLSAAEASEILGRRISAMVSFLLGPPPAPEGAMLLRELSDPSKMLPWLIDELFTPQLSATRSLLRRIAPGLRGRALEHAAFSVVAQGVFYRVMLAVLQHWNGGKELRATTADEVSRHVLAFSLGGLQAIGGTPGPRPGLRRTVDARRRSSPSRVRLA